MEEKELLSKISLLKSVKPREEWVFSTRQELLGDRVPKKSFFNLQRERFSGMLWHTAFLFKFAFSKPVLVVPVLVFLAVGGALLWQVSLRSLPGDALYSLRTTVEQVPLSFSAEEEKVFLQIELAQKHLADLRRMAEENKIRNLASAIKIYEANATQVSQSVTLIVENQPDKALQAGSQIVQLQKEKAEIEKILGAKIGEEHAESLENATKKIVEYEFADLETRSLTEGQLALFESAKADVEQVNYELALEKLLLISVDIHGEG